MEASAGDLNYLHDLVVARDDPLIRKIGVAFLELAGAVEAEAAALAAGTPVKRGLAASVIHTRLRAITRTYS